MGGGKPLPQHSGRRTHDGVKALAAFLPAQFEQAVNGPFDF